MKDKKDVTTFEVGRRYYDEVFRCEVVCEKIDAGIVWFSGYPEYARIDPETKLCNFIMQGLLSQGGIKEV